MTTPLALLLAASNAWAGEFPIGLYNVRDPEALDAVAAAGFTHILPAGDEESVARAAQGKGLSIVGLPGPVSSTPRPRGGYRASSWYISDEPDVNNQSPEAIRRLSADVRRWDPGTPLVLVVGDGRRAADYASSVDAVMVDWYPVPHLPIESFGAHIASAVAALGAKPVWGVVQAMDWRDYPQRDARKERVGRFPMFAELRFMSFDAVVKGASGLFFFEFQLRSEPSRTLLDFPENWLSVSRVARELRSLKPWLEAGPGARLRHGPVEGRLWRANGKDVVVLVNGGLVSAPVPTDYLAGGWEAVFEDRLEPRRALPDGMLTPRRVLVLARR